MHVIADRVSDTSTTTGTGNITVANAAPTGFRTFDNVAVTDDTFDYEIAHRTINEWETGRGRYNGSHVFVREFVTASSNSGALVNFSAGTKDVFLTNPAQRIAFSAAALLQADFGSI